MKNQFVIYISVLLFLFFINCKKSAPSPSTTSSSSSTVINGDLTDLEGLWVEDSTALGGSYGIYNGVIAPNIFDTSFYEIRITKTGPSSIEITSPTGVFPPFPVENITWSGLQPDPDPAVNSWIYNDYSDFFVRGDYVISYSYYYPLVSQWGTGLYFENFRKL